MDFESPDVEKDFPGLYASETGRKSNESDCKYLQFIHCFYCVVFPFFLRYILLMEIHWA